MAIFKFKQFNIEQEGAPQKMGTDAMILGALAEQHNPNSILDLGTGTGVIALMLAQRYPKAKITGLDIDTKATKLALQNFQHSKFPNDFNTETTSFLNYQPNKKFDLIVSNPPYFNTQMPSLKTDRSLARHEGEMTLQRLIIHAASLLNQEGCLWIIVPALRTNELLKEDYNVNLVQRIKVFGKPEKHVRDILVFTKSKNKKKVKETSLTIRTNENIYSKEYIDVTQEYHFNNLKK